MRFAPALLLLAACGGTIDPAPAAHDSAPALDAPVAEAASTPRDAGGDAAPDACPMTCVCNLTGAAQVACLHCQAHPGICDPALYGAACACQ